MNSDPIRFDVVIIGAGLAGLSLARQLLLDGEVTVLHLDRESSLPIARQKVGESNVQVAGHYFAKVLDMEDHLFHQHVMKYNLRFMWKAAGRSGRNFEDFSHSYIRTFSNIACYQLDRNKFEGELIRRNREEGRYTLREGARITELELGEGGGHRVVYECEGRTREVTAGWLVDTSGRNRRLAAALGTRRESEIRHSSSFFWTEGLVNIEKLTESGRHEIRKRPERRQLGHLPFWLATNHFMGEGFWFWVIPLHDRTSFGLVYDNSQVDAREVSTKEKLLAWLFERFPLFERELSGREIIDFQVLRNYSHDCEATISADQWAMSGFAGRFTDPLYSPGGDMIAIHNTLITDAILSPGSGDLKARLSGYEAMMKTVYRSFVPSFHDSYKALGDQECFTMKYVWELSVYFGYYVFPFVNDLYSDRLFLVSYLRRFARLGPLNRDLLVFISAYYEWKRDNELPDPEPRFFDFTGIESLRRAEQTFYEVGVGVDEAIEVLDRQLENLRELARFLVAHICARVAGNPDLVSSRPHAEQIDLEDLRFDAAGLAARWQAIPPGGEPYPWRLDPRALAEISRSGVPA